MQLCKLGGGLADMITSSILDQGDGMGELCKQICKKDLVTLTNTGGHRHQPKDRQRKYVGELSKIELIFLEELG
jgi:hypothetical protein